MLSRRHKRYLVGMALALLVAAAVAVASRSLIDPGALSFSPGITIGLLIALAVVAIAAAVPWWRSLDEMQREVHLASWYWGGSFGALVGVFSAAVLGGAGSDLFRGAALVVVVQFACFVTLLTGWRIIRSGQPS